MTSESRGEPNWLDTNVALAIHDRQLAEHGGGVGVRDLTLLESALAKPLNHWNYGERDFAVLAASYAYGIARNHPFIDGNKRTAWVMARLFLAINDLDLQFDAANATRTMLALAASELSEEELASWFRDHLAGK